MGVQQGTDADHVGARGLPDARLRGVEQRALARGIAFQALQLRIDAIDQLVIGDLEAPLGVADVCVCSS